jgi:beta-lactam-binding protein with PASTA domain
MPDLFGMKLDEAILQLKAMGIEIKDNYIVYDYQQGVQPGIVISQTPEANSPITETDILSLTVSSEDVEKNVIMPDLSGKTVDQAVSFLNGSGFGNCFVYEEDSSSPEGTVIRQSPEQGTQTPLTDVFITISKYKVQSFNGKFSVSIAINEKESNVKVVLQEIINGAIVNFIEKETSADTGRLSLSLDLSSASGGSKTVILYVNNEEYYSGEVEFR